MCDVTKGLLDDEEEASSQPVAHRRRPFSRGWRHVWRERDAGSNNARDWRISIGNFASFETRSLGNVEWKLNGLNQAAKTGCPILGQPSVPGVGAGCSAAGTTGAAVVRWP